MTSLAINVSQGGRVVIPAEIRQKMGIRAGDQVLLDWSEDTGELRLLTRKQRLNNAQKLAQKYADPNISVVDEFIEERRKAALDE
uniref:SpoVT/AbrB domain-containing protein n=1 Tax=uncultured Thiotrichaceae bacterium TaxID=298394 RepID=A0A6S6SIV5_9GAMM|nr:MAG: SpoVT/AbrB domain-containing protein [uncultured Thiotrichaceae bacterium]